MVKLASKLAIVGVGFIAIVYQFLFKSIIFDTLGYGRKVLSIKDFNHVKCERVEELGLEGCEVSYSIHRNLCQLIATRTCGFMRERDLFTWHVQILKVGHNGFPRSLNFTSQTILPLTRTVLGLSMLPHVA
jgi:hypothetical protein